MRDAVLLFSALCVARLRAISVRDSRFVSRGAAHAQASADHSYDDFLAGEKEQHEQQQATRKVMGATVAVVDTADMVTEQQWWGCAGRVAYS